MTDIGSPVPAGYNPDAKEIFTEGLRIPPVKLWEKGRPREDVINFMLSNMRSRRDQEGDLKAQLGAVNVGARRGQHPARTEGGPQLIFRPARSAQSNPADDH